MKVCFIRPPFVELRYQMVALPVPPIGFAYVVAAARAAGHEVVVIDAIGEAPDQVTPLEELRFACRGLTVEEVVERVPLDAGAYAVSVMFSQDWGYVRRLTAALKERFPAAVMIGGGEAITALPEYSLETGMLDHAVLGEGEETIVELLDALTSGRSSEDVAGLVTRVGERLVRTAPRPRIRKIDDVVRPAWDLFPIENYLERGLSFGVDRGRTMPLLATRGCPYQCTFCSSPSMWTTRWTARDPAEVLDEIEYYQQTYNVHSFDFYDLTAIIKRDWILDFCKRIQDRGLTFVWQLPTGTRSEAIDADVAEALYATGCRNITYAPESGSPDELRRIKKKIKISTMLTSMRSCIRQGLKVKVNIVLGFPEETPKDLFFTFLFLIRMALAGVSDALVFLFEPYPGTVLYDELRERGKLPPPSDQYFLALMCGGDLTHAVSFTDHLSGRQLGVARVAAMVVFYSVSYLVRPWRVFQNLFHLATGRHETLLEKGLANLFARRTAKRPPSALADKA
jgi:anaerobic magnesium-protoporphyrin IX monomethyl ester cyclase